MKGGIIILIHIIYFGVIAFNIFYLFRNRFNLKRAVEFAQDALYPKNSSEFEGILIPNEWQVMEPLAKYTRSYNIAKWGTVLVFLLLIVTSWFTLTTDWLNSSFLIFAYLYFLLINMIRHRGNLYILKTGLILHGKYYSANQIRGYAIETIVQWHELYGIDKRLNNAYKLTIHLKKLSFQPNFIVIKDLQHLEQIKAFLEHQGIYPALTVSKTPTSRNE